MFRTSSILTRFSGLATACFVAASLVGCATTDSRPVSSAEPDRLVADAQRAFNDFLRDPDQTWVHDNLDRAKAVLIAPELVKAGFIFGGSGGRAVLVAKEGTTWAGPAFYDLATASVGFQAGIEVSQAREAAIDRNIPVSRVFNQELDHAAPLRVGRPVRVVHRDNCRREAEPGVPS